MYYYVFLGLVVILSSWYYRRALVRGLYNTILLYRGLLKRFYMVCLGVGTVHLTLRESVHERLREYAAEMGVPVTDLIKIFILEGLKRLEAERAERIKKARGQEAAQAFAQVLARLEQLEELLNEKLTIIEGDMYRLEKKLTSLRRRVERLEEIVEEKLVPGVEEPELVSS